MKQKKKDQLYEEVSAHAQTKNQRDLMGTMKMMNKVKSRCGCCGCLVPTWLIPKRDARQ